MILTVCADKGSPGASTTAAALGMVWPGERLLLEADPSGGDAALRMRTPQGQLLPRQPSVAALAVDAREGALPSPLASYAHPTSIGLPVIAATDMGSADLARLAQYWPLVALATQRWPGTVIADVGRLQEDHKAGVLAAQSAVVLLVGRASAEGLHQLRERAAALAARIGQGCYGWSPVVVAVICPARDRDRALHTLETHLAANPATAAVPVAGWIAEDPRGVAALREGQLTKRLITSELARSMTTLARMLQARWPQPVGPATAPTVGTADAQAPAPAQNGTTEAPKSVFPQMDAGGWPQ